MSSGGNQGRRQGIKQLSSAQLQVPQSTVSVQAKTTSSNQQQYQRSGAKGNGQGTKRQVMSQNQVKMVNNVARNPSIGQSNLVHVNQRQHVKFNDAQRSHAGNQEHVAPTTRPELVAGGPTTIINNNNINFYAATPNQVAQQVPYFPQGSQGAIFGLVPSQSPIVPTHHPNQVYNTHQEVLNDRSRRPGALTQLQSLESGRNSINTSLNRQVMVQSSNQQRQFHAVATTNQVGRGQRGPGSRIQVKRQSYSREQAQLQQQQQLNQGTEHYGAKSFQQSTFSVENNGPVVAQRSSQIQEQASSKISATKKQARQKNQVQGQFQMNIQSVQQVRKTGRKINKVSRHPSLQANFSIEPSLIGSRRDSLRKQSQGEIADEPDLSGSQNFGSSIERIELQGPLESYHESLVDTTQDEREGPSLLKNALGQPHSMSVYELQPQQDFQARDPRPYYPNRLQDDSDIGTGGLTSSINSSVEHENRKIILRRDQLALHSDNMQKIKPNVQIRRRHGALVSQDERFLQKVSKAHQQGSKTHQQGFSSNQNTDRLLSQEAYVNSNAYSPTKKGPKKNVRDKFDQNQRNSFSRPSTAVGQRDSSRQQKRELSFISSNNDQKRGKLIKNIEEVNAYQQETPYLNRKVRNDERKLHLNLPINSKQQKHSIKKCNDLIYNENHYQSQQELSLPRMSGKLADGSNGHYSQKSLLSTESAKEDGSMRHSARRLVPMGQGSLEKLASCNGRNHDQQNLALNLQMSTPNQEYSGGGDNGSQIRQLTERIAISPQKEDLQSKQDARGDLKSRKVAELLGIDDNIQDLEQQILNVEYQPLEQAQISEQDLRRLSAQATSGAYQRRQPRAKKGQVIAYQSEHDIWLMENAQILDQEVKVIAIGMNKDLEKTQRINWKKQMQSGSRKAIERLSKR